MPWRNNDEDSMFQMRYERDRRRKLINYYIAPKSSNESTKAEASNAKLQLKVATYYPLSRAIDIYPLYTRVDSVDEIEPKYAKLRKFRVQLEYSCFPGSEQYGEEPDYMKMFETTQHKSSSSSREDSSKTRHSD